MADADARRAAAAARRERILNKGSDRLAKITTSGRGEEAKLWDTTSPTERKASQQVRAATSASHDPDDVDISTLAPAGMPNNALQSMMQNSSFADRFAGTESPGTATPNDMGDMLAQMLGGGAQGPGGQPNPMLAQMLQNLGWQQGPAQPQVVRPRTWTDRLIPLMHILTMLGIAFYAVFILEPFKRSEQLSLQRAADVFADQGLEGVTNSVAGFSWSTWAKLSGEGGVRGPGQKIWNSVLQGGLAEVPLFYIFLVAELLLQSAQLVLQKNQIPPPSLFNTILPYLPPQLAMYATTGLKYWALLGTLIDDFAVLVLSIGLLVLLAEWRSGA